MAFIIRDFDWEDEEQAAKAATMFNDWDSVWPGGFTRGVPSTAAKVQEEHRRASHLAVLVVEHEGEFVGYCNLEAAPGQKDVSYIGLLGANEKVHGKGVGKMLLREMIRRVTEFGYKQVTLGTWAGNTKAVPLYKKTGFNWIPETDVFMRNFIPGLLAMPLVQTFLDGRDWYDCLERDLTVAPDDVTWNGMKVYPYRFRNGERTPGTLVRPGRGGIDRAGNARSRAGLPVPVRGRAGRTGVSGYMGSKSQKRREFGRCIDGRGGNRTGIERSGAIQRDGYNAN